MSLSEIFRPLNPSASAWWLSITTRQHKKKKKRPPPQAQLQHYTPPTTTTTALSLSLKHTLPLAPLPPPVSHLCPVGTGAWNANRWCRARGESPPGRGRHYHSAGRSGWLPRCDDRQPGCRAASVRARSAIPIPLRRMLVTSYSWKDRKTKTKNDNTEAQMKEKPGRRVFKGTPLMPLRRAALRTAALHPSWTVCNPDVFSVLSVLLSASFGMTAHAIRTFHVCSFGGAAIIRSFYCTGEIQSVSWKQRQNRSLPGWLHFTPYADEWRLPKSILSHSQVWVRGENATWMLTVVRRWWTRLLSWTDFHSKL